MSAHPIYDHHEPELEQMPDLGEWCYEHMVEKDGCVYCHFGEENLIFMYECPRCSEPHGAKTWGWHSPDGQEYCVRCMAMGFVHRLSDHELVPV